MFLKHVKGAEKRSRSAQCSDRFVNFMVYYFELFGTLKLYIVNRSIVHTIRLHVSEVRAPARLALTYMCAVPESN